MLKTLSDGADVALRPVTSLAWFFSEFKVVALLSSKVMDHYSMVEFLPPHNASTKLNDTVISSPSDPR